MKQSMKDLWMAFVVGVFLMFAVLVLNFGNYKQPLIVFSIIPLLFIWAWWLLLLFKIPFGFAAQLGMFGLIWVGVNDAILLIERYNDLQIKWTMTSKWIVNSEQWIVVGNNKLKEDAELNLAWQDGSHSELVLESNYLEKNYNSDWEDILYFETKKEILFEAVKSRLIPAFLTTLTTVLGLVTLALKDDLWWSLALSFMWGLIVWTLITLIYIPAVLMMMDDANLENPV